MAPSSINTDNKLSSLKLGDIVTAVNKHRVLAGAIFVVCLVLAVLVTSAQTRIYESTATVYFDPRPPQPLGEKVVPVVNTTSSYWDRKEHYNTEQWILTSRAVLEPVVTTLRLHFDRGFVKNLPTVQVQSAQVVSVDKAVDLLLTRLTVKAVKESRLAKISCRDPNAERAKRIITAVVEFYLAQHEGTVASATSEASSWLRQQLITLRQELDDSERALYKYKRDRDLLSVSIDDQSGMLREELSQISDALTQARTRRQQIASRSQQLDQVKEDSPSDLPSRELLESQVLQDLRTRFMLASQQHASLVGQGRGHSHPDVMAAAAEVSTARTELLAEVSNIKRSLAKDVQATDAEIGGLYGMFEKARKNALEVNQLEIDYNRLKRTRDTNEQLLTLVNERSKESDLTEMLRPRDVRIVEQASIGRTPVSPNVSLNLLIGTVLGLLFGVGAATARHILDRTIRQPDDIEEVLSLPFLGYLPASEDKGPAYGADPKKKVKRGRRAEGGGGGGPRIEFVAHENPTNTFSEATRAIRTSIMFSSPDKPLRRLLVTSANAGEGKTTVAANLAITLAQLNRNVLLLDCDLRRPRIHKIFEVNNDNGLTGAILDPTGVFDHVVATRIPKLSILPSGVIPPNPSELFHSQTFAEVLDKLGERFDVIVMDSPPLGPVTDSAVLAPQCDGAVLVVRAQHTSKLSALRATRQLHSVGANLIGTVLNAFSPLGKNPYYYRGYEYRQRDGEA